MIRFICLAIVFTIVPCTAAFAAQQAVERTGSMEVSAELLVGRWSLAEDCSGGTTFRDDGTYALGYGAGRWRLSGSSLIMTLDRQPSGRAENLELGEGGTAVVELASRDAMLVDFGWETGGYKMILRFQRCG